MIAQNVSGKLVNGHMSSIWMLYPPAQNVCDQNLMMTCSAKRQFNLRSSHTDEEST